MRDIPSIQKGFLSGMPMLWQHPLWKSGQVDCQVLWSSYCDDGEQNAGRSPVVWGWLWFPHHQYIISWQTITLTQYMKTLILTEPPQKQPPRSLCQQKTTIVAHAPNVFPRTCLTRWKNWVKKRFNSETSTTWLQAITITTKLWLRRWRSYQPWLPLITYTRQISRLRVSSIVSNIQSVKNRLQLAHEFGPPLGNDSQL